MYAKNDKRRLYQLLKLYLSQQITASTFCDEFYFCYDLELNHSTLTELEMQLFAELDKVCSRFSPYEEDYKLDPKAFVTETELHQVVSNVQNQLNIETEDT